MTLRPLYKILTKTASFRPPIVVFVLACFLGVPSTLLATDKKSDARNGEKVYFAKTKSYFEMVKFHGRWRSARISAQGRTFKGVRGRLAKISSSETHQFIVSNFNMKNSVWIGLRYWCVDGKLRWTDGEVHPRHAYSAWGRLWNYSGTWKPGPPSKYATRDSCKDSHASGHNYLPVHYWGKREAGNFWNANGPEKGFHYYLVEYPTGSE